MERFHISVVGRRRLAAVEQTTAATVHFRTANQQVQDAVIEKNLLGPLGSFVFLQRFACRSIQCNDGLCKSQRHVYSIPRRDQPARQMDWTGAKVTQRIDP